MSRFPPLCRAVIGASLAVGLVGSVAVRPAAMRSGQAAATPLPIAPLWRQGQPWTGFLAGVRAQRERWLTVTARAGTPPADIVTRLRGAAKDLQLLIVAEDWCPDSVEAVPYVVGLAAALDVPVRLLDRQRGAPLLERFRTRDGRPATPTIVIVRSGQAVDAWVERPAIVQDWFFAMATSPEAAKRFNARRDWFDDDRGRTVLREFVALAAGR